VRKECRRIRDQKPQALLCRGAFFEVRVVI
jgi:hypothetical protein